MHLDHSVVILSSFAGVDVVMPWAFVENHALQMKGKLGYFAIIPTSITSDRRKLHARS